MIAGSQHDLRGPIIDNVNYVNEAQLSRPNVHLIEIRTADKEKLFSRLKFPPQSLCVPQLALAQPCILPAHLVLIALFHPPLRSNMSGVPTLLFKWSFALRRERGEAGAGRAGDRCASVLVSANNPPIQMLGKGDAERGQPIEGFDGRGGGCGSIQASECP